MKVSEAYLFVCNAFGKFHFTYDYGPKNYYFGY